MYALAVHTSGVTLVIVTLNLKRVVEAVLRKLNVLQYVTQVRSTVLHETDSTLESGFERVHACT